MADLLHSEEFELLWRGEEHADKTVNFHPNRDKCIHAAGLENHRPVWAAG